MDPPIPLGQWLFGLWIYPYLWVNDSLGYRSTHTFGSMRHTQSLTTRKWPWRDQEGRKEGNVLFNNVLDTFLFMCQTHVKDNSDSERGNPLSPLHGVFFLISSKGLFYMHHPHRHASTAFVIPVMEHWLVKEIAMGPPNGIDPTTHRTMRGSGSSKLCGFCICFFF